jgi:hypothetical protein
MILLVCLSLLLVVTAFLGLRTSRNQRAFRSLSLPVLVFTIGLVILVAVIYAVPPYSTPVTITVRNPQQEPLDLYLITAYKDLDPLVQERVWLQPGTYTTRTVEFDHATVLWTVGINRSDRIVLFQSTSYPDARIPSDTSQFIQEAPSTLQLVHKSIEAYNRDRLFRNSLFMVNLLLMILISLQTWAPKWTERMLGSRR